MRVGDWKLVWQATLPSRIELFNLMQDPGETTNLAAEYPEIVTDLQGRVEAEARGSVPPLIFSEAMAMLKPVLFGSVRFPDETETVENQP